MGTPYFNRDESIILTAHKVKFDSALSDAMLTSQRLIFIDAGYAQFRPQTIPLDNIETVIPGEDAFGNLIITLSLAATTPGGATHSKELAFPRHDGGDRKQERSDWVQRLKEQIALVRQKALLAAKTLPDQDTDIVFDDTESPETDHVPDSSTPPLASPALQEPVMTPLKNDAGIEEVTPEITTPDEPGPAGPVSGSAEEPAPKTPLSSPFHPASVPPGKKRNFTTIAAIVIVILAVAGGVFIYANSLPGMPHDSPVTVTTQPVITAATTIATPVPTTIVPAPTVTAIVTPVRTTQPPVSIPKTGVWVHVQYAGNFTGQVGLSGGLRQVSGSGDQFYRITTISGIVDATIQKLDGSGKVLAVEVYKDGKLVDRSTVAVPGGSVDLHVDLKAV